MQYNYLKYPRIVHNRITHNQDSWIGCYNQNNPILDFTLVEAMETLLKQENKFTLSSNDV